MRSSHKHGFKSAMKITLDDRNVDVNKACFSALRAHIFQGTIHKNNEIHSAILSLYKAVKIEQGRGWSVRLGFTGRTYM